MKKTILMIVVLLGVAVVGIFSGIQSNAQNTPIKSEGNFIMESENVKIYSEDIKYLKSEIDKLLNECK